MGAFFAFGATSAWAGPDEFFVTTTNLSAGDTFQFSISAKGTYVVDCGDDGTLSGTGVTHDTIDHTSNTNMYTYTCTYNSGGVKTVAFAGDATGYNTGSVAAIKFNMTDSSNDTNVKEIAAISGSLGQIFGTVANPSTGSGQPGFRRAFFGASNMTGTNIDDPNNSGMKYALPPKLFDGVYGSPVMYMFEAVFWGCSGLTGSIPPTLFSGISGSPADYMFSDTFTGCRGLTGSIPTTLFSGISGSPANYMFNATFGGCIGLTGSIPSGLFGNLSGAPANYMFAGTFSDCYRLTGFGNKTYVPGDFLENINTNTSVSNQVNGMFQYTQLDSSCPGGTYASTRTQFNDAGKPWCSECPSGTTSLAGSTNVSQCGIPYNVTFAAGSAGGNTPTGSTASISNRPAGDTITLPASTFTTPTGYSFNGWSCDNSIGNKAVGATFTMPAANVICTAQWAPAKFSVTTTSNASSLRFYISASGTFTVDCGAGGTLSGTGVSGNTITKNNTSEVQYVCNYNQSGTRTIYFDGPPTAYNTNTLIGVIRFGNTTTQSNVASVDGDLSALFPSLGSGDGQTPSFYGTFSSCNNLTTIPSTLFSSVTRSISNMFNCTFCSSGLTTIPSGLFNFANTVSGQGYMFMSTFYNCTSLTTIPANLFSYLSSGGEQMFGTTFEGCTALKSIPSGLFNFANNISGQSWMFTGTFENCTGLGTDSNVQNPIPANLFSRVTSNSGQDLFHGTFKGCTGLKFIPSGLFDFGGNNIVFPSYGFYETFANCTGLGTNSNIQNPIPDNLFAYIRGGYGTFKETFKGCTGLKFIPSGLFNWGSSNGVTNTVSGSGEMFYGTFSGCTGLGTNSNIQNPIPADLFHNVVTGAPELFKETFAGCTGLTSIPSDLFFFNSSLNDNITYSGRSHMFDSTFTGCSGLTSLPDNLFAKISSTAEGMFESTFENCTGLTGYVPTNFFKKLIDSSSPYTTDMMLNVFHNTGNLATTTTGCPSGMQQYITNYESYWDTHISCKIITYTVSFMVGDSNNNGTGTTPSGGNNNATLSNKEPGATITTLSAVYAGSLTGYTFTGWLCNNNIGNKAAGATFTMPAANVTCTAQWSVNVIDLTWDGGGTPASCTYGSTFNIPTPTPRTGYVFMGWNKIDHSCGLSGVDFTVTANAETDVRWKPVDPSGYTMAMLGLTENSDDLEAGEFEVTFSYGTVKGMAKCSALSSSAQYFDFATQSAVTSAGAGSNCWCGLTSYTPTNGESCNTALNWVYMQPYSGDYCVPYCTYVCAVMLSYGNEYAQLFYSNVSPF